jgi:hypothetical protein
MKRIGVVLLLITGCSLATMQANAQVSVSVNIGTQPQWGPVGYDRADYYYLPDVEAYYYIPRKQFIYLDAGRWIFAASLPGRYHGYDLYGGYKVVINEPRPYDHFYDHRSRYARYRGWNGRQDCIRDYHRPRYDRDRDYRRDRDRGYDRGHGRGHGHGRGRGHDRDRY